MYYSKSKNGFYSIDIHGDNIPTDAVEITKEHYKELLEGQAEGRIIGSDNNGIPILKDPPEPTSEEAIKISRENRQRAYLNESDPLFFKWQRGESTEQEWHSKVQEIRERFPKPIKPTA